MGDDTEERVTEEVEATSQFEVILSSSTYLV